MINEGLRHGPHNPLRDQSRTGNLQKRAAGHKMRERYLIFAGYVKGVGKASTWEARKQYRYPLKRDIAAFKLERIRSRERARSPISSCDSIPTLTGVSRSPLLIDRKSTRLNSSHVRISYAVFCLKKKKKTKKVN